MFKYAVFVFVCCSLVAVNGNQPCLGAPEVGYTFVPSPMGCDKYILCFNGQTYPSEPCPPGFLFNPSRQDCSSSSCTDCAEFGIQNLPHPIHCNQYIECTMGQRTFRTCPSGLMFDRNIGYCNIDSQNVCKPSSDTTTSPTTTVNATTTTPPTTTSPTTTTPTTTTTSPTPICKQGDTYHPHPTDCTRFFLCVNTTPWEQQCPNNFHWNSQFNICDDPSLAGCNISGGQPTDPPLRPPVF